MDRVGVHQDELWDEEDGFFYDVLRLPQGDSMRLKVRSMVGLVPLFATAVFDGDVLDKLPTLNERIVRQNAALMAQISNPSDAGCCGRRWLSPFNRRNSPLPFEEVRRFLV